MDKQLTIIADYREKPSGVPDLLAKKDMVLSVKKLKSGDYLINNTVLVERKTKEDFVLSLISCRLFAQCAVLKQHSDYQLLIIEGNPYTTDHEITKEAIKGALLSISVAWQIPIFFTRNKEDTANVLEMTGKQSLHDKAVILHKGYRSKKIRKRQLYFLQALPDVGSKIAIRLLKHFETIEQIVTADIETLQKVEGIGKKKARKLREFITRKYDK
jgi:Fanconi anemia group M protein